MCKSHVRDCIHALCEQIKVIAKNSGWTCKPHTTCQHKKRESSFWCGGPNFWPVK